MKMHKFEIGQKVEVIADDRVNDRFFKKGATGVVVGIYGFNLDVNFSESNPELYTKNDHDNCWYVISNEVEVITE